jgi:hypothetical protein
MKAIVIYALAATILAIDSSAAPQSTPASLISPHGHFRLIFKGYDGEPRREDPSQFSFQVDTIDLRQPSEFLRLGDIIPHTPFRLIRFTYKTQQDPKTNEPQEVSELTIKNVKTGESIVLIYNRVTDTAAPQTP